MIVRRIFQCDLARACRRRRGSGRGNSGPSVRALEADFTRLNDRIGTLSVGNPKLIHARAIPADGPLQFGWRVYFPGPKRIMGTMPHSSNTTYLMATAECSIGVGVREDQGQLSLFFRTFNGPSHTSSTGKFGDASLADFLRGRWDRLVVEQFARDEVAVADPNKSLTLLRLSIPPDLVAEAKAKLSPSLQPFIPRLYNLTIP